MQLSVGETVLLKHTRERARVRQQLDHGQWLVETELDQERFPVHEDDLEPVLKQTSPATSSAETEATADIRLYPDTDGPEIQLAFIPVGELDYMGALLNFSTDTLVFSARLLSNKGQQWAKHGLLGPTVGIRLGRLYRDLLNESATVEFQVSRKAELGTDSKQEKVIKLKPKLFHKNTKAVTWFPEELAVFDVFAKAKLNREAVVSLKDYTQQNAPPLAERTRVPRNAYGVLAAAEFQTELDLHVDKLEPDASGLAPQEILEFQLEHMRRYLDVAIRLGIERVFLIHGNGKGTLRNRIHQTLAKMGDIEDFKHEYHPKYGHGATEVILLK